MKIIVVMEIDDLGDGNNEDVGEGSAINGNISEGEVAEC